jgi:hypothetical protein
MRIGIDISQMAYPGTGVANYLKNLVENLLKLDKKNKYVLFFSSLRKKPPPLPNMRVFRLPPTLLEFIWNRLHICPLEWFVGEVDVFITSDWTEPPASKAKKVTILYDLIVYKHPQETAKKIVAVQKRKLKWVKKESAQIICISQSTKKDAQEILGIKEERLAVAYPGGIN